jgi:USP6 N-terminal-like protein
MHGLFILGFPKLTRFLAHHDAILTKFLRESDMLVRFVMEITSKLICFLAKLKKHFDQCNLDSILYSLKWFFVIFIERVRSIWQGSINVASTSLCFQIPFSLCLRVWDIYLLEGESVATTMAYTVLKVHKNKLLKLKDMDMIVNYLQVKLQKDFGYDDDYVIKVFEQCSEELRKAKMELPPPAPENEFPQKPFGVFVEPTKDAVIGHRKSDFSEIEKEVTENVINA